MADPNEPKIETTVTERPSAVRGWWIAALVAIIAVAAMFFMLSGRAAPDIDAMAASQRGGDQAVADKAQTHAQAAAASATQASARAASSLTQATRSAADSASSEAERTAQASQTVAASAADAATDAGDAAPKN